MTMNQQLDTSLRVHMVQALGELVTKACELRVKNIVLRDAESGPIVEFFVTGESGEASDLKRVAHAAIKREWFPTLSDVLLQRTFQWPNPDDTLWVTNPKHARRLFCAPKHGEVISANLLVRRPIGAQKDQIVLDFTGWDLESPFWEVVGLTGRSKEAVRDALDRPTGLILVGAGQDKSAVDGGAVCLAYRPDAILYRNVASFAIAAEVLELAKTKLVVVEVAGDDTVEILVNFSELLARDPELVNLCYHLSTLSFVYRRTKRVCGACARASVIDPNSLASIPELVRPPHGQSYMFGRGCPQCHQSAYRGSVELESILVIDDGLRNLLRKQASTVEIATYAYRAGTRTLMESGLQKVYQGRTSIEGVTAVARTISEVFRQAIIAARTDRPREAPKDEIVKEALSSLSTDFFHEGVSEKAGLKLLLIEDDPEQLDILKLVFGNEGYNVEGVSNGKDALQYLSRASADLVICDLMMPVMNGHQFVEELRRRETGKHVPVLVLTAVSNPESEVDLLAVGADDYCCKDVNRRVLLKRVEKLLSKSKPTLRNFLRP